MKVVGYAGSRSAFSKSICLGEKLKTMLREKNIEMELYTARNNVVEECRGCGKCFDEGLCPQDQEDSMEYIRKKILEADLIVLLSPVYLNNVSGAMKTFLDRIGSWVHTLRKRAYKENSLKIWMQPKKYAYMQNFRGHSKFLLQSVIIPLTGRLRFMKERLSISSLWLKPKVLWKVLNSDRLNRQRFLVQRNCLMKCQQAK